MEEIGPLTLTLASGRVIEVPAGTPLRGGWCPPIGLLSGMVEVHPCYVQIGLDPVGEAEWVTKVNSRLVPVSETDEPDYLELQKEVQFEASKGRYLFTADGDVFPLREDAALDCWLEGDAQTLEDLEAGRWIMIHLDETRDGYRSRVHLPAVGRQPSSF